MHFMQSSQYRQIYTDDNLWRAWRSVKAKNGQPGPDGVSVNTFEHRLLSNMKAIQGRLATRAYRPGSAKIVKLSKSDGGKRPIAILSLADRITERAVYQVLNAAIDPLLHPNSHAFRRGRSTKTAIEQLVRLAGPNLRWFGHVDIKSCFPSLAHWHLKRQLRTFVPERDVRKLVSSSIAPEARNGQVGIRQGGPLSPLLSNIYLDTFDRYIDKAGIPFVRYADNVLFLGRSKQSVANALKVVQKALAKIALTVHEEKTIITHFSRGVAVIGYLVVECKENPKTLLFRDLHADEDQTDSALAMQPGGHQLVHFASSAS